MIFLSKKKGRVRGCTVLILLWAAIGAVGCAQKKGIVAAKEPMIPERLYELPPPQRADGAMWPGDTADNLFFIDAKARNVGDIVTVVVDESATSSQSATTDTSKDSDLEMDWQSLFGIDRSLGISNFLGSADPFDPRVAASLSRSNQGSGTTTRAGSLSARVSAMVVDKLPNGNLAIEGRRSVTVNHEEQIVVLRGIVREVDIDFDNTVSSRYIANASITYTGEGVVADEQRVGWLTRILTFVWPF